MTDLGPVLNEIRASLERITARLDARDAVRSETPAHALKRSDAAKAMGISRRKLEQLISAGKVATAEDAHLVPLSEVKRYTAPKTKRQRKPSIGIRATRRKPVDGQSDDAVTELRARLRKKARTA